MRNHLSALLLVLAAGCGGGRSNRDAATDPPDDGKGGDVDAPVPDIDAAPPKIVRFIAIGDTGKANTTQREVAVAFRDLCAQRGCDFVIMLGDNVYDAGVTSVNDPEWQNSFETPYADIDLPFYAVLGNHDYGGKLLTLEVGGLGNEWNKGPIEVAYTQVSTKWKMPATHYTFSKNHVGFIMLDTNSILWSNTQHGDQAAWLPTARAALADKDWIFVAGHHPYRSSGEHGNAGAYDAPELAGISLPNPLPIQNGQAMKDFFDAHVRGIGQVYFAGHDHSRQWLNESARLGGTEMIVSGAGGSTTSLRDRGNQNFYADATQPGFLYVVVDGDTMTGEFHDKTGALNFTRTIHR